MQHGRIRSRYVEVMVHPDHVAGARSLSRYTSGKYSSQRLLFEMRSWPTRRHWRRADTSIADLFVAVMSKGNEQRDKR